MRKLEADNLGQDAVRKSAMDGVGARPAAAFLESRPQTFGDQISAADLVAQVEAAVDAVTGGDWPSAAPEAAAVRMSG
jgi:hypothetical protein